MKQKAKILALSLAAALAVGSTPVFAMHTDAKTPLVPSVREYDGRFSDIKGAWCADAVKTCYAAQLMEGRQASRFDAASPLTNAQIMVICARLHDLLTGGNGALPAPAAGSPWYQSAYDRLVKLVNAQTAAQTSPMSCLEQMAADPNHVCVRQTFSQLLLLVLDSAEVQLPILNNLTQAVPDLTPDDPAYSLYRWGILNGTDAYGTYGAQKSLNRGQAAAILARVVDPAQRLHVSFQPFDQCRDVLALPNAVVLLTIDGMAYTTENCAEAMCQGLRREQDRLIVDGYQNLTRAMDYTEKAMKLAVAVEALANQEGITATDTEVTEAYGRTYEGYEGRPASVSQRLHRQALLHDKLLKRYEKKYGTETKGFSPGAPSVGAGRLNGDLEKLCDAMTVVRSDAFQNLDWKAASVRLQSAPAAIGSSYARNW